MKTTKKKVWKRSRITTTLVHQIREVVRKAGYTEELAITPLLDTYSVLASKEGDTKDGTHFFNLRLNKASLEIVYVEHLRYDCKRDHIRRVFRHKA